MVCVFLTAGSCERDRTAYDANERWQYYGQLYIISFDSGGESELVYRITKTGDGISYGPVEQLSKLGEGLDKAGFLGFTLRQSAVGSQSLSSAITNPIAASHLVYALSQDRRFVRLSIDGSGARDELSLSCADTGETTGRFDVAQDASLALVTSIGVSNRLPCVAFVDMKTFRITQRLALPAGVIPGEVAIAPDARFAYVVTSPASGKGANAVYIIDVAGAKIAGNIPVENADQPLNLLRLSPDGALAYLGCDSCTQTSVPVIDTQTNTVDRIPLRDAAALAGIGVHPNGTKLYVPQRSGGAVVLDTATYAVRSTIPAQAGNGTGAPSGTTLQFTPDGRFLFLLNAPDALTMIDTSTDRVAAKIPLPASASPQTRWVSYFFLPVESTGAGPGGDAIPPAVSIASPLAGATVSGVVTLSASATDNASVAGVQFHVDANNVSAEDTTEPYAVAWNTASLADGDHVLTATARDATGNYTTSAGITVTVNNSPLVPNPTPAGTYYVSPSGNDTNAGSTQAPWATFSKAWSVLQPGNTLIIKAGTYRQDLSPQRSGKAAQPITVKAEVDGTVFIDGDNTRQTLELDGTSYLVFEGLTVGRSVDSAIVVASAGPGATAHHNIFRRIGAYGTSTETEGTVVVADGSHHNVFEDMWIWGTGRYKFLLYGGAGGNPPNLDAPFNTLRRIVIRYDPHPGTDSNPQAAVGVYSVTNTLIENVIALDGLPNGPDINAGFYVTGHTPSLVNDNRLLGIISLNNSGEGMQIDTDTTADRNHIENAVFWSNDGDGLVFNGAGYLHDNTCNHCTIMNHPAHGFYNRGARTALKNTIIANSGENGIKNAGTFATLAYNDVFGNNSGDYDSVSPGATDLAPAVNPGIKYIVRIEPGSGVKGKGENGTDIGANVLARYQDGVLTATPLWPWPNQDRIRKEMCSDARVSRGFCTKSSLTDYIWSFAGTPPPSNVSTLH